MFHVFRTDPAHSLRPFHRRSGVPVSVRRHGHRKKGLRVAGTDQRTARRADGEPGQSHQGRPGQGDERHVGRQVLRDVRARPAEPHGEGRVPGLGLGRHEFPRALDQTGRQRSLPHGVGDFQSARVHPDRAGRRSFRPHRQMSGGVRQEVQPGQHEGAAAGLHVQLSAATGGPHQRVPEQLDQGVRLFRGGGRGRGGAAEGRDRAPERRGDRRVRHTERHDRHDDVVRVEEPQHAGGADRGHGVQRVLRGEHGERGAVRRRRVEAARGRQHRVGRVRRRRRAGRGAHRVRPAGGRALDEPGPAAVREDDQRHVHGRDRAAGHRGYGVPGQAVRRPAVRQDADRGRVRDVVRVVHRGRRRPRRGAQGADAGAGRGGPVAGGLRERAARLPVRVHAVGPPGGRRARGAAQQDGREVRHDRRGRLRLPVPPALPRLVGPQDPGADPAGHRVPADAVRGRERTRRRAGRGRGRARPVARDGAAGRRETRDDRLSDNAACRTVKRVRARVDGALESVFFRASQSSSSASYP